MTRFSATVYCGSITFETSGSMELIDGSWQGGFEVPVPSRLDAGHECQLSMKDGRRLRVIIREFQSNNLALFDGDGCFQ
jgi:hypothetical protein